MKMISSTSTTSTRGVTLISDCSEVPLPICMSVPLRRVAGALGDESHALEAGRLERLHGLPDFAEVQPGVAADHDLGIRLVPYRGAQAVPEILGTDHLVVDVQAPLRVDGDADAAPLLPLLVRLDRLGQGDV